MGYVVSTINPADNLDNVFLDFDTDTRVQVPALAFTGSVILNKPFSLSGSPFPHQSM